MRDYRDFYNQFRETDSETASRWLEIKAKRKAAGLCWQCSKPVRECWCFADNPASRRRTIGDCSGYRPVQ